MDTGGTTAPFTSRRRHAHEVMTMPRPITATQASILNAIRTLTTELGHPPTLREISSRTGLSSLSTVGHHIRTLQKQGRLTYTPQKPRTIRLADAQPSPPPPPIPDLTEDERAETLAQAGALRGARAATTRARNQARRANSALDAVRSLHKARRDYPPSLADTDDRECLHCGHDVDQSPEGHRWDRRQHLVVCMLVPQLPAVCSHCVDQNGQPLPYPCRTITVMDNALHASKGTP